MAPAANVAEDDLVEHQREERLLALRRPHCRLFQCTLKTEQNFHRRYKEEGCAKGGAYIEVREGIERNTEDHEIE